MTMDLPPSGAATATIDWSSYDDALSALIKPFSSTQTKSLFHGVYCSSFRGLAQSGMDYGQLS